MLLSPQKILSAHVFLPGIDYGFQKFNKIIYSYRKDPLCPFKNLPHITYKRFKKQMANSIYLSLALDYPYKRISINLMRELDDYY